MKIPGQVKEGRFVADNPAAWPIAMREWNGKKVVVEIDAQKSIRTLPQNNRYFGVLLPLFQHYLSQTRDVPLSKEQAHWVAASAFHGTDETTMGMVPKPTRTMTTKEFSEYCDKLALFLQEKGYPIPQHPVGDVL